MKGYKVSDAKRCRTVGVACKTLDELRVKGCIKLNLEKNIRIQLLDGTFVDDEDYFQTLPPQTVLLFLKPSESAYTGANILYNALQAVNLDYLRAGEEAQKFFTHNIKEKVMSLSKLINKLDTRKVWECSRVGDPDWFEGIDSRSATKEEFMGRRSQERIRGYMYKTKDDLRKSEIYKNDRMCRKKLTEAVQEMNNKLKDKKYFSGYFDRTASDRLCHTDGNFKCKGLWDASECRYTRAVSNNHMINPYTSREARIVFSTWNFDHVVERSRSIVPALLEAAKQASKNNCAINADYFYRLLFTTDNLKLVHIVCHDKGVHNIHCDHHKFILTNCMV
jgi:hypothetical protein